MEVLDIKAFLQMCLSALSQLRDLKLPNLKKRLPREMYSIEKLSFDNKLTALPCIQELGLAR